jgi:uncharacterized membrane protein
LKPEQRLPEPGISWWAALSRTSQVLVGSMFVMLGLGILVTAVAVASPSSDEKHTEFYALGPDRLAVLYPVHINPGETFKIVLGITNHEGESAVYTVQIYMDNVLISTSGQISIADGQTWEGEISLNVPETPGDHKAELYLVREGRPSPYRRLLLQITSP